MVLVGCESSGVVRRAFRALGHDAWSCDLLPADDGAEHHLQTDVLKAAGQRPWDLGIFHPPCTYLSVSGLHWNKTRPERAGLTAKALDLVRALLELALPRLALENPIGCISSKIRRPSQIIQPHDFGEDASKATCLWLRGLPPPRSNEALPSAHRRVAAGQREDAPALGQPDRLRAEQASALPRPLEAAQQDLRRHRRGHGVAVGRC